MFHWLLCNVVGKAIATPVRRQLRQFEAATHAPQQTQEQLLQQILAYHRSTDFARDHHFSRINSVLDFQKNVPLSSYDYFEPYLERVRKGDFNALLADKKIHMFALTSGTTATRKTIPVTSRYLADYRRGWNMWGLKVYRAHQKVRLRPIVQIAGDWQEYQTEAGIHCGAVTGLTASMQKKIIRWMYCVPACISKVKDPAAKNYLILRLSMPRHVGMVISANPSTLVNLAKFGDQHKEELVRDIADGALSTRFNIPSDIREAIHRRIRRKRPERAIELERIIESTGHLYPKDYWSRDCVIGNWTGGSVGCYLRQYPTYYGQTPVRDVGLIASEGRMTIPFENHTPSGVLDVTSHFFEFIPEAEGDSPLPITLSAHEIEEGQKYYIVPTTAYGLYRYKIHDLVRVTGFYNQTPLVEFLSKGSLFSNLTGEKVSEYHVTGAMKSVLADMNCSITNYALAPCWDDEQPYYGLFVERGDLITNEQGVALADALDRQLKELNIEYAAKRDSLRLGAVRLQVLPEGAWQDWDRERLKNTGGTPEQYKHPCLISDTKFRETMRVEEEIVAV